MHTIVIILQVVLGIAIGVFAGWYALRALELLERISEYLDDIARMQGETMAMSALKLESVVSAIQAVEVHAVGMRATLESVVRVPEKSNEEPRMAALEAPQVPSPHGEARTLLLMNRDHTTAHEVTWHRDVPKVYAYGGRVFELLGRNDEGQWEFLPC